MSEDFTFLTRTGEASLWLDLFARSPQPEADEISWALALAQQAMADESISSADQQRYDEITQRYLESRQGLPPPSLDDINWLIAQQTQGLPLSAGDQQRFLDLKARLLLQQAEAFQKHWQALPLCPALGPGELDWALQQVRSAQADPLQFIQQGDLSELKQALRILKTASEKRQR